MSAPAPAIPKPRVLLVEDDTRLREALRELLEEIGIDVVGEADNGSEGVQRAVDLQPDVVLMDLRMPVMGGIEAAHHIKEAMPNIQVVILTAYDDRALKDGAGEAGVYAYLVKGCPPRIVGEVTVKAWQMKLGLEERERPE